MRPRGNGKGLQFLRKALQTETDDCIIWPYYTMDNGYGQVGLSDSTMCLAHRQMCRMAHGEPVDESMQAAHSCANRACVNKRHLRWATQTENEEDKREHGTWFTRISTPKLDVLKVTLIRYLHGTGIRYRELSEMFKTPKSTIKKVVLRHSWRHI